MRYMIIVKATAGSEAGTMPGADLLADMQAFHAELARAGVLLEAAGLKPSRDGWRVHFSGGERRLSDGPFAQAKELVAGYTLIQVRSREEAREWARRYPNPAVEGGAAQIEVRPLYEPEDFAPSESVADTRRPGRAGAPAPERAIITPTNADGRQ